MMLFVLNRMISYFVRLCSFCFHAIFNLKHGMVLILFFQHSYRDILRLRLLKFYGCKNHRNSIKTRPSCSLLRVFFVGPIKKKKKISLGFRFGRDYLFISFSNRYDNNNNNNPTSSYAPTDRLKNNSRPPVDGRRPFLFSDFRSCQNAKHFYLCAIIKSQIKCV